MDPHGPDLRAREPQARLLPLDGISDRPLADQQHHESAAQSPCERSRQADVPGLARPARRGTRRRAGNGGLGRLAACFLDSMATMQLPAMGYGLRYEYGMFRQSIEDGWQHEQPDNWLRRPDPWEVARPDDPVEIGLNCSFEVRGGALRPIVGRPSTLIGIPFDRPVVGYGGKTINTLRLWAAAAPDYFDFQA